ncbi:DNA mismatch repair protein MSH2 [Raphanus sativus]|nr:DNA mismatch repair protein MSH2 [Raphanus sativus]
MEGNFDEPNKLPELKLGARVSLLLQNPTNDSRAVRFFDRKDYYTAHGENSVFIAQTYYHTTTALRQIGSGANALSSVSISKNMFETIVRDLLLERMIIRGALRRKRVELEACESRFSWKTLEL